MAQHDTSIQFVIYFKELHAFATEHGELKEINRSYRFHPFENGFINALYLVKKVLLGKMYGDYTPQKVIIYQDNKPIYQLPRVSGTPICNDRKEVKKIAYAINELSEYEKQYKKQLIASTPKVTPIVPKKTQEETDAELNTIKRSVYNGIKAKILLEKLDWTPSVNQIIIAELQARNEKTTIESYFKEYFDTLKVETKKPTTNFSDERSGEPTQIGETFKKTTKVLTNSVPTQVEKTELPPILIESYVDLLSKDYEKTGRKATEHVKNTFKNAFSRCTTTERLNSVYANFVTQIHNGQF
ncbi:hypothetical protein ACE193_15345 [Bernardetia sp. OM2101]|uniref:hypothetical protein n=1 Tax=Bernardetia sp. OM2101 TaxID=3344876 RepID=UPI0035D079DD